MPRFDPSLLATWTSGTWTRGQPRGDVTGFGIDTRQLRPGQIFVALKTGKRDGHDFLAPAQAAGAVAALVSRAHEHLDLPQLVVADPLAAFQTIAREHRRRFRRPVIGVTGSAGKTSTKNLLALLLGPRVLATEGNLNNHLGVPLTLTRLEADEHEFAVIEAGISGPGEMAPLARMIEPDLAMVTLVGAAHTAELGGLEGVAREKAVLPAAVRPEGLVVFPADCLDYAPFRALSGRRLIVGRAAADGAGATDAERIQFSVANRGAETAITLAGAGRPEQGFTLRRVSDGMAQNAALAILAAQWLGVGRELIQRRLRDWSPAPLRGEIRREGEKLYYLDCYNANPASMHDALAAFEALAAADEPRCYVIGCMEELGDETIRHHRELGARLRLRPEDHVWVIGAAAVAVREGALAAGGDPAQVEVVESLRGVVARLATFNGAVFVKGSRRYQLETILEGGAATAGVH